MLRCADCNTSTSQELLVVPAPLKRSPRNRYRPALKSSPNRHRGPVCAAGANAFRLYQSHRTSTRHILATIRHAAVITPTLPAATSSANLLCSGAYLPRAYQTLASCALASRAASTLLKRIPNPSDSRMETLSLFMEMDPGTPTTVRRSVRHNSMKTCAGSARSAGCGMVEFKSRKADTVAEIGTHHEGYQHVIFGITGRAGS